MWDTLDLGFLILNLSYLSSALFYYIFFMYIYFLQWTLSFWLCSVFLCLTEKDHVSPRLSLTNVAAFNYLLGSQIFVNDDGKFWAVHLILDYEPLSNIFQEVGNTIRANDYRLARIDVSRPHFLALYDFPPVDHPIPQGVPLAAQPIQQVPLGRAVAEERVASSSSSLEEEIDKFQFEKKETLGVEAIFISEAEEETDEYLCVQAPIPVITYVEDSSDDEAEEMAPKSNQSLRELMKGGGGEQGVYPTRSQQVQAPNEPSISPSSASCWS